VGLEAFCFRVLGCFLVGFVGFVLWTALGVPFGFWGLALCGLGFFLGGWLWLFPCILHLYLRAPYAFYFNKTIITYKKN
jgi:hypothetical protein